MTSIATTSILRLALAALAAAALLGAAAPPSHAAFPGRDGRLVYSWFDSSESQFSFLPYSRFTEAAIRVSETDGTRANTLRGCTRATDRPDVGDCTIGYGSPTVSPDGRRVAFDAGNRLALIRFDGSGFRLLPAHSADDGQPAFSPDGRQLAFTTGGIAVQGQPAPPRAIRTSDLAGAHVHRVTAHGLAPSWSTRNWIAFLRADGVYRVRPDGHGLRHLVDKRGCDGVDWSPDGTRLAFTCLSAHSGGRLFVADGEGRHVRRVSARYLSPQGVAWSPSGRRLLVASFEGTLAILDLDGAQVVGGVTGGAGAGYSFGAGSGEWQPLPRR